MMSLHHFFDNELGGSLHGTTGKGLTNFGRQAISEMLRLGHHYRCFSLVGTSG